MRVRASAKTDIGRARKRNEDAYLMREPVFAVADGMGGHRAGDIASTYTLEVIADGRSQHDGTGGEGSLGDGSPPLAGLVRQILEANRLVMERGDADRELRGMGTTVTAVVTDAERAHVAHVGDSRAYLLRDGTLQQLTEDHTLVQRMVREGKLSQEEAGRHPHRSILTRAVGVDDELSVDELTLDLLAGDRMLLCTDGLTSMVEAGRIQEILADERDPAAACQALVDAANAAGGEDNITVLILDVLQGGAEGAGLPGSASPARGAGTGRQALRLAPGDPAEPGRRRVRWGRVAAWVALAAVVVVAAWLGVRAYVGRQWYVGESAGQVAIYNGIPAQVLGVKLSHVEETFGTPADRATALRPWAGLPQGITANSRQDAESIVRQIQSDVAAAVGPIPSPPPASPTPAPTLAPSPSASGSAAP